MRVLIAEDCFEMGSLLSSLFTELGVSVETVEDGSEAIRHARKEKFDVILMDLRLPNIGGLEAMLEIKKSGIKTPIIAISSFIGRDEFLEKGFDEVLAKPFGLNEVVGRVFACIKKMDEGAPFFNRIKQ